MYRDRENKNTYAIALTIIIIRNICYYTMEHLKLYLLLTLIGLIIDSYEIIRKINFRRIPIYSCIIWLGIIYTIFTINGIFRVRYGTYNWDMMLYTCVQNGAIFIALKEIVISPKYFQYIRNVILTSSIFSLFVLAFFEISNLGVGGVRIGDSLSGNVNVAGANFGILSIFMVYICEMLKKIFNWIILAFVVGVMLLTGSKMTLIILALDLVYFFINSKNKGVTLLLVIGAGIILLFLVFSVPVFYNVIGYRVEDMMYQLFGIGPGHASNSTNVRKIMLMEGFTLRMKVRKATVSERVRAFYEFIVSCRIQQKLKKSEQYFEAHGEVGKAKEYSQIYAIVMDLFDKMVQVLGEESVSLREFKELLEAGLSEAKVGIIPPSTDQVLVGDMERTRLKDI